MDFPPAGGYGDYILYYHKPPPGVKPFGTFIFALFGFRRQFAGLKFAGGLNGIMSRFPPSCPPCVKGGRPAGPRGDWREAPERRLHPVRIRPGPFPIVLSAAQSLRPSLRTGAPHLRPKSRLAAVGLRNTPAGVAFTQGRLWALPRQCKLQSPPCRVQPISTFCNARGIIPGALAGVRWREPHLPMHHRRRTPLLRSCTAEKRKQ